MASSSGGELFCKRHARQVCSETAAVLNLDHCWDDLVPPNDCGARDQMCEHFWSWNCAGEAVGNDKHFSICCQSGKVELRQLRPPPAELDAILRGTDEQSA